MPNTNHPLYDQAHQTILEIFNDRSLPVAETIADLQGLKDEIEMLLDTLQSTLEEG